MLRKSKLRSFIWYTSVGLLVLFAVVVTIARLSFSSVAEYRWKLEEMAGKYLGQPIAISGMDARIIGLSPSVVLTDVVLLQEESGAPLSLFDSMAISLDPIASLLQFSPIVEMTISGASLKITHTLDGRFEVDGLAQPAFDNPAANDAEKNSGAKQEQEQVVGEWFLSQNRLAIINSRVQLLNEKSNEYFRFNSVEIELHNDGERHRLNASALLPKGIGKELRLAADITGDPLRGSDWDGSVYFKGAVLKPERWERELSWGESAIRSGTLNIDLWSEWQEGLPVSARTQLDVANLVLARGEHQEKFKRLSSDARLQREPQGWHLEVDKLTISQDKFPVLNSRFEVSQTGQRLGIKAQLLSLQTIGALLPFLPALDEDTQTVLKKTAPTGVIKELWMWRDGDEAIQGQGEIEALAMKPWEKLPGVQGLNARFQFNGEEGGMQLSANEATLELPRLFRDPLSLKTMSGNLNLQREGDGWHVSANDFNLANDDIALQLAMELRLEEKMPPWLSIQGRFKDGDASTVPRYLPAGIMGEQTLAWLDKAFIEGRVLQGSMHVHGFGDQFPFRDKQGRFEVLFDTQAVQLHYQDNWPDLTQVAAEVHFDDGGMFIAANDALIFDARVSETMVSINNFREPQLLVDGHVDLSVPDGLRFLRESPLSRHGSKMLETMNGAGDTLLSLQLAIPLAKKVKATKPLAVDGEVTFSENQLKVVDGVDLQALNGALSFTERSFRAKALKATLFDKPVTVDIKTESGATSNVVINASGRAAIPTLRRAFDITLLDHLKGESDWQAEVVLPRGNTKEGTRLRIDSSLVGVTSMLPHPLSKNSKEKKSLQLDFHLSGDREGERHLILGDELGIVWREQGQQKSLQRAQLRLGGSRPLQLPQHDVIEVVGEASKVSPAKWHKVMRRLEKQGRNDKPALPLFINMDALSIVGDIEAGTFSGNTVAADFPKLTFRVMRFDYDDFPLGEVDVKLTPNGNAVVMENIQVKGETFTLSANGSWVEGANTFLDLSLDSPNMGKLLKRFGFASVIQDGKLIVNGKLWWPGVPAAINLAKLNGELAVMVKKGTIVDVEPGAGRMLGILSVPALPRRLFLDFSDIFKEGFAFESIKGDIRIEKGQTYTSNLRLKSVPASILVSGRSGLVEQDMDQDVYVVPNVSDTVSVASALAWGPQVAAAVVLLQEVFQSGIKEVIMVQYHVSGSWDKPKIKRIERAGEAQMKEEGDGAFFE